MNKVIEVHILQNFAPSNLNRDDTGSPKDAIFGGVRRGRISSQCLKRAIRTEFRRTDLLGESDLAIRTKRVVRALGERLEKLGHPADDAERVVTFALSGLQLKMSKGKSEYLLFLGNRELESIAQAIHDHWDELIAAAPAEGDEAKKSKKTAKAAVPAELVKALEKALDGGKAVDVALFGRMLADLPERNRDAAAQVAHAISTHKVEREFDFYTAVDDLQPDDTAGADMLGTVEFNSACYYRYALIDIEKLVENLQGDTELALRGLEAFLRATIHAIPSGKQNSFAAHNPPGFIGVVLREDGSPRSLANAFELPVRPSAGLPLTAASMNTLAETWARLDQVYGGGGFTSFVNATTFQSPKLPGEEAKTVDELIDATMKRVADLLEG